jgi:hypothetical protein
MIIAILISLIFHIFCFTNVELTFAKKVRSQDSDLSSILFLGPIFKQGNYYPQPTGKVNYPIIPVQESVISGRVDRLNTLFVNNMLKAQSSPFSESSPYPMRPKKPLLANLTTEKTPYFEYSSLPKIKNVNSSIMFYPPMPYHFLLYFRDRQTAHVEVSFFISPEGKIVEIKRKISSGNPEVDLLIMRNLINFLNHCKSNFVLGSWQTVKIDLSP